MKTPKPIQLCNAKLGETVLAFIPTPGDADPRSGYWCEAVQANGGWVVIGNQQEVPTHYLPTPPNPFRASEKLDPAGVPFVAHDVEPTTVRPMETCAALAGEWALVFVPVPTPECLWGGVWTSAMRVNDGKWRTAERVFVQPTHWSPMLPNPNAAFMPLATSELIKPSPN